MIFIEEQYPSAEKALDICIENYNRVLNSYDKVYDKLNIATTLMSAIFIVFVSTFDVNIFSKWDQMTGGTKFLCISSFLSTFLSIICIGGGTIWFLLLSRSKKLPVVNDGIIIEKKLYEKSNNNFCTIMIAVYVEVTKAMRHQVDKKQSQFNLAIVITAVGLVLYAIGLILCNIGGF